MNETFFLKYMLLNVYQNKTFYRVWTPVSAYFHRNLLTLINWFFFLKDITFSTLCMRRNNIHMSQYILNSGFYILSLLSFCSYGIFYPIQYISLYFTVLYVNILLLLIIPKSNHVIYLDLFAFTFFPSEIIGTRYLCDAIDYNCLTISTHK